MNWKDVIDGAATHSIEQADALEFAKALPENSVDFVFGSPPYPMKGERYGEGSRKWTNDSWVAWMLAITQEMVRACKGDVMWVVNGTVKNSIYYPACEGLVWEWHLMGGVNDRSVIWHKNAPPNRMDYFSNDWEFVLCFKKNIGKRAFFDWEAVATEPKYKSGGHFRQRDSKGKRRKGGDYPQNKLARPRDVVRATVGGGHMGSDLASENEAPFPESLVEYFVPVLCPPNGIVVDCFSGSGTTAKVALGYGRRFVGSDLRESQVELTKRRILEVGPAAPSTIAG